MSIEVRAVSAVAPRSAPDSWLIRETRFGAQPVASFAVAAVALLLLMAPALWNGYPLLQFDTGGYLARWYEGYLVPSRSTVFGIYLHLGEGLHFWPQVAIQSVLATWIVCLTLRVVGLGGRALQTLVVIVVLSVMTTLPWLTSILLTDIFAGLSVLALHLTLFHPTGLKRWESAALFALVAFSAATHSATLAMLLAMLAAAALAAIAVRGLVTVRRLFHGAAATAAGALMLLSTNYALSGQFAWTPGGYGIAFGRMLQDGIVARYLNDHCPDRRLKLCPYRNELPATADEFLWNYGVFNELGRFTGLADEMRTIVLHSLAEYPVRQIATAARATARQLLLVATGGGILDDLPHTYGIIERFLPGEVPAMRAARQQHGELQFDRLNYLHIPIALASTVLLLVVLARLRRNRSDTIALLAASVTIAVLSNAFVCGALSGPHDRYGARVTWVASFVVLMAAMRMYAGRSEQPA